MSQRGLNPALGFSFNKTNFYLQALIGEDLLKMQDLNNSKQGSVYAYRHTSPGNAEEVVLTRRFLMHTIKEHELLKAEVALLKQPNSYNP